MKYTLIKTKEQHEAAMTRLMELGTQDTLQGVDLEEFELIALLVENYEKEQGFFKIDTSGTERLNGKRYAAIFR